MAEAHAHAGDHDAHGEHDDDYAVHSHITSIKTYLLVFGALLFLTGLTVAAYNVRLGEWNLFVAVLIAMVKSSLVGAYFMHLKYENKFNTLFFVGSLIFVGVFLAYTLNDTDYRGEESVQGRRVDPSTGDYAFGTAALLGEQGEFTPFPTEEEAAEGEAEAAGAAAAEAAEAGDLDEAAAEEAAEAAAEAAAEEREGVPAGSPVPVDVEGAEETAEEAAPATPEAEELEVETDEAAEADEAAESAGDN